MRWGVAPYKECDRIHSQGICRLLNYFETIVISEMVGVEKPDIRIMQIVLERFSLDASACLYIGDHPFDILCSKKAGIDCVWITAPDSVLPDSIPFKEDFRIQKLEDLLNILDLTRNENASR